MIGVNDLAKRWDNTEAAMGERYMGRVDAAADLIMLTETAWHPVSEPPTEADADKGGVVMVVSHNGVVGSCSWNEIDRWDWCKCWARVKDVVLMPPQGGE